MTASWPEGAAYLQQQKRRLPTSKYRRLHLNLPGSPTGAFLDQGKVLDAIVAGRKALAPEPGRVYRAFVDMSGGSNDDAVLCIAHLEGRIVVIDVLEKQAGGVPFNPRDAVRKFAGILKQYGLREVWGDAFAGQTFPSDFAEHGITYRSPVPPKTEQYEGFEPVLNAAEIELPDDPKLQEQALTLVHRGARVDHEPGGHDDFINAVAGVVWLIREKPAIVWTMAMAAQAAAAPYHRPALPNHLGDYGNRYGEIGERLSEQLRAFGGRRFY
jgi:hypothetical protein